MIRIALILMAFVMAGCNEVDPRLMGEWKTTSEHYRARYSIHMESDSVRGEVIYYNDGTTVFNTSDDDRKFIFKHLMKDGEKYVDAISGATQKDKNSNPQMWTVEVRHSDTLAIGQKIGKQTRTEIWTRVIN